VTELVTAGLWRRGAAAVLDALLGVFVWSWGAMCLLIEVWGFRRSPLDLAAAALLIMAILALGIVQHVVYHLAFVGGCGQTPGQMALSVAVVRRDGRAAGYGRALVRCLAVGLSLLTLGVGFLGALFNRERRGLADWLAGTRVVRS
jgi:uncharacterized RDD family membrane protein YckC